MSIQLDRKGNQLLFGVILIVAKATAHVNYTAREKIALLTHCQNIHRFGRISVILLALKVFLQMAYLIHQFR